MVKEKAFYVEDANYPGEAYRFWSEDEAQKYANDLNDEGACAFVTTKLSPNVVDIIDLN